MSGRQLVRGVVALLAALGAASAATAGNYDTGATDTSIKLGQTMPYSDPAPGYAPTKTPHLADGQWNARGTRRLDHRRDAANAVWRRMACTSGVGGPDR